MSTRYVWTNGPYTYIGCSHQGCQKKAAEHVTDHDCCGRSKHSVVHIYQERDRLAGKPRGRY